MHANSSLCRCFCGSSWQDEPGEERGFGAISVGIGALSALDIPEMPEVTGMLSYSTQVDQQLRGNPIREGHLWHLSAEESVQEVHLSLFVNGFGFKGPAKKVSVAFSPFSLVRNCKFQSNQIDSSEFADFKIFKVSLFAQHQCYYFGVRCPDAHIGDEERSKWVLDISTALRLVTQSLFPPFRISCDPLAAVASTHSRLMAGYLLHSDGASLASVLYCELRAHQDDKARLVLYENESCKVPVVEICITAESPVTEKVGINCSCFCVEDHDLSSRTLSERKLWMRAISNIKVKLANSAPNPDDEELTQYREAVKEHLHTIRASLHCKVRTDALLQPSSFNTFQSELTPFSMSLWASIDGREAAAVDAGMLLQGL